MSCLIVFYGSQVVSSLQRNQHSPKEQCQANPLHHKQQAAQQQRRQQAYHLWVLLLVLTACGRLRM
jgi:hypothetical protein